MVTTGFMHSLDDVSLDRFRDIFCDYPKYKREKNLTGQNLT